MSSLSKSVDACLKKMAEVGGTGKGSFGEQAVFRVCEEMYQSQGGILYHSYSYKTDPTKEGNIKRNEQGKLFVENLGSTTEIDVLFITKRRIFPIEVKAYKAKEITLMDEGISGCFKTDKSPVHQNEMHCRHLYPAIFKVIPEGDTRYIIPIVVFVDKCKVIDKRSDHQKEYVITTVLNSLKQKLYDLNTPLEYDINLAALDRNLKEVCVSYEKYLPFRDI